VALCPSQTPPDPTLARLAVHRLNRCAPAAVEAFVLETWRKLFVETAEIGSIDVLALGLDPQLRAELRAAQSDAQAAEDLAVANRDAVASGCFGVPWIVADDDFRSGPARPPGLPPDAEGRSRSLREVGRRARHARSCT